MSSGTLEEKGRMQSLLDFGFSSCILKGSSQICHTSFFFFYNLHRKRCRRDVRIVYSWDLRAGVLQLLLACESMNYGAKVNIN